mgnify:CR=1 FL=1
MTDDVIEKRVTPKQRKFIDAYLRTLNATQAAREAGYSGRTAYSIGWENLRKPEIKEEISRILSESHMSAEEALDILATQARGDMAELMDISSVGFNLDLQSAKEKGLTRLIRKVKQKTTTFIAKKESDEDREVTELEVELYDAQSAAKMILQMHGLFTEKVDVTSGGEKIEIVVTYADKDNKPGAA